MSVPATTSTTISLKKRRRHVKFDQFDFLPDILKVSSSGGYTLAKITNTLKKNTMEKLKEFVSLFCLFFGCCRAVKWPVYIRSLP